MSAASQGMRDATAFLLAVPGVELDRAAHSGGTPLMFAAAGGHLETLRLLVDAGGDVNARVAGAPGYVASVAARLAAPGAGRARERADFGGFDRRRRPLASAHARTSDRPQGRPRRARAPSG